MNKSVLWALLMSLSVVFLGACNITSPQPTPTVEVLVTTTETATVEVTATETATATAVELPPPTVAPPIQVVTAPPEVAAIVPTAEPTPTETPAPYVHVIREGETLGSIVQLQPWGYPFDMAVINAVVALNDNIVNADILPPPGNEILIPRRTATPIPEGIELTLTSDASIGLGERVGGVVLAQGAITGCHNVVEGETLVGIADIYNTTLEVISQLNQNLNWFGCNFTQYSGGPNCNPIIRLNQCITVPLPTPIPTHTATPSGRETATPTPTLSPPRLVFPPDGAVAPAGIFALQWVSVGILQDDEVYLVELQDTTNGTNWSQITRGTSMVLPSSLVPTDGQTHTIQWRVGVGRELDGGRIEYRGGIGNWRTFQWQSR